MGGKTVDGADTLRRPASGTKELEWDS
jgi:hypothetical protein